MDERKTSQNVAFWHFVCSRELLHKVSGADLILYNFNLLIELSIGTKSFPYSPDPICSLVFWLWLVCFTENNLNQADLDLNKYDFSIELSKKIKVSSLFTIKTPSFFGVFFFKKNRSLTPHHSPHEKRNHAKENIGFMDFLGFELASLSSQYLGRKARWTSHSSMVPVVKKMGIYISNRIVTTLPLLKSLGTHFSNRKTMMGEKEYPCCWWPMTYCRIL